MFGAEDLRVSEGWNCYEDLYRSLYISRTFAAELVAI